MSTIALAVGHALNRASLRAIGSGHHSRAWRLADLADWVFSAALRGL